MMRSDDGGDFVIKAMLLIMIIMIMLKVKVKWCIYLALLARISVSRLTNQDLDTGCQTLTSLSF